MDQLQKSLENLIQAVKDSPEYREYRRMSDLLHMEPEKEKAVNEFRKRNYQLRTLNGVDLYAEMDHLDKEYANLRSQPNVNEFLAAELSVCRMVQRINYRLMEEIDFE